MRNMADTILVCGIWQAQFLYEESGSEESGSGEFDCNNSGMRNLTVRSLAERILAVRILSVRIPTTALFENNVVDSHNYSLRTSATYL